MALNDNWGTAHFTVRNHSNQQHDVVVSGRDRWALEALIAAGDDGCTPIETPAPRWSAYVYNLRGLGVPIQTHTEPHGGPFKGTHARYTLAALVARKAGGCA